MGPSPLVHKYWKRGRTYREAPTLLTLNRKHPLIEPIFLFLETLTEHKCLAHQIPSFFQHFTAQSKRSIAPLRGLLGIPKRTLILALARSVPGIQSNVIAQCTAANDPGRIRPLQSLLRSGILISGRASDFPGITPVGNNRSFGLNRSRIWSSPLENLLDTLISTDPYLQSKCAAAKALQLVNVEQRLKSGH